MMIAFGALRSRGLLQIQGVVFGLDGILGPSSGRIAIPQKGLSDPHSASLQASRR